MYYNDLSVIPIMFYSSYHAVVQQGIIIAKNESFYIINFSSSIHIAFVYTSNISFRI